MKRRCTGFIGIAITCLLFISYPIAGCKSSKDDNKAQDNGYQETAQQQANGDMQSSPDPVVLKSLMEPSEQTRSIIENPNLGTAIATPPSAWLRPTDTSTWTPAAREAARLLSENDYEGAVDVLYQDILNTRPSQSDHFMFYAEDLQIDTPAIYKDPSVIYRKYRDADRSGWSEEQQAAADLLVALTYEFGDNDHYFPYDLPETEDYYPFIFDLELQGLARMKYEEIIQRYRGSRIAVLATIALERWYFGRNVPQLPLERVTGIRDEIEASYPDSVYLTWAQSGLSTRLLQEGFEDEYRAEHDRILTLPNVVIGFDSTADDYTLHGLIEHYK